MSIFIEGDQGCFGQGLEWSHLEPPLGANERLPHQRLKVGRPTGLWPRTGLVLVERLLGGP